MKKHSRASTEVLTFVSPEVEAALRAVHKALKEAGVRHAIAGGLAVGAYGHIRATKDVDFLVGDEAFVGTGGIVSFAPGVPFQFKGILADMVAVPPAAPGILADVDDPVDFDGMPLVSPESLIVMKLVAKRRKDLEDIKQLLLLGVVSEMKVRKHIAQVARSSEDAIQLDATLEQLLQEVRDGD